jgi:hypothetical protein
VKRACRNLVRSRRSLVTLCAMETLLTYRGRAVTATDVEEIRTLIALHSTASRRELSKRLCEAWNWVQQNGALRDMVCRGLMLALHRAGWIELPPIRQRPPNPLAQRKRPGEAAVDETRLVATLSDVRPLELRQVRRTPEERLFNSLIEHHHYLGYTQPVGEHLKYLVYAQGRVLAALAWCSASRAVGCRDRFLGWSVEARRRNIGLLAYNTRFLILPWVEIPHLASHVLGACARRLSADWERLYGHPIHFVETYVDPTRFRGTCYRAANWILLGQTTGRGPSKCTKPNRPPKEVLALPLHKRFRQLMAA